jgi:hypothetical protein
VIANAVALAAATIVWAATGCLGTAVAAARSRWQAGAAALAGLGVVLVPFFVTYWPALREGRDRPYDEVAGLAPRPFDVVNVGGDNVVWGRLLRALTSDDQRLAQLNRATAVTPVLLIAAVFAGVALAADLRRRRPTGLHVAGMASAVTALVLVVLPVQFGFGGAWSWLHRFVPGGAAIRVYSRIEVVNVVIAVIAVACWLAADTLRRPRRWIVIALPLLIAAEQLNTTDDFRRLDRDRQVAMLAAVPPPPSGCEVFWLLPEPGRNADHASIDAMRIAHHVDLPTVNGYSGWTPDGWDLQPASRSYEADVEGWLAGAGLSEAACAFDAAASTWHAPRIP